MSTGFIGTTLFFSFLHSKRARTARREPPTRIMVSTASINGIERGKVAGSTPKGRRIPRKMTTSRLRVTKPARTIGFVASMLA